jgi:predicted DNA-binding transcriptional regulator AlpA
MNLLHIHQPAWHHENIYVCSQLVASYFPITDDLYGSVFSTIADWNRSCDPDHRILTSREAAERLGISTPVLARLRRKGAAPSSVRLENGRFVFLARDVDRFRQDHELRPKPQ